MLDEELLRNASEAIPSPSENLKESIITSYYEKTLNKRSGVIRPKLVLSSLLSLMILLVVIATSIGIRYSKNSSKISGDIGSLDSETGIIGKKTYLAIAGRINGVSVEGDDTNSNETINPGTLTASVIDDNSTENYQFFLSLLQEKHFSDYPEKFDFNCSKRVKLTFKEGSTVKATLLTEQDEEIISSVSNKNGEVYLFPDKDYKFVEITYYENGETKTLKEEITGDKSYIDTLPNTENIFKDVIDLMFVIDATGSMGDEIRYLIAEIGDVITRVKALNANAIINLAILMYRDTQDEYVTRYSDFTTDINAQIEFLSHQEASGGGDYPEAVDKALDEALNKNWTNDYTTKLVIHVADAYAHDEDISKVVETVKTMSKKGIRLIPVSSSGIDKQVEYFLRSESMITSGMYAYLTNDSGVGGDHIDASVKEKQEVELLSSLLVRIISGYHTGVFSDPVNFRQDNTYINQSN